MIRILLNAVTPRLTQRQVQSLAELVDKQGRSIIKVGAFQDCAGIRDKMSGSTRRDDKPLNTVILPSYTVAHQHFAVDLLEWVTKLFTKCSGFRAIFAEVAFSTSEECGIVLDGKIRSVAEAILTQDAKIWKAVRRAWGTIVIEGLLKEYDSKLQFSRVMIFEQNIILREYKCLQ